MAFFDSLGKKITKTSQDVVQKTKDTAETMKLNGMISDEERVINAYFNDIGRKFFELHSDSYESEFEPMIIGVKEAQAKIKEYSDQVMLLRGMIRCPNCSGEIPANSAFCSICGEKIPVAATEEPKEEKACEIVCASCGESVASELTFCTNCGAKIVHNEQEAVKPNICKNCGGEIVDGAKFCVLCGTKAE